MVNNYTKITELSDQIYHCSKCGFCQSVCPVYDALKTEYSVSRGKIALLYGLISGKLEFTPKLASYMELCLGCQACNEFCPSGVTLDKIFIASKEYASKKYGLSLPKQAITCIFGSETSLNFFSSLLHLYTIANANFLESYLPDQIPFISKIKLLNTLITDKTSFKYDGLHIKQIKPTFKIMYFLGCINKYVNPSVLLASVEILKAYNCEVLIPHDQYCCGKPAKSLSAIDSAKVMAKHNINIFSKYINNFDYIVVDCASCGVMLKSYDELLGDDEEYKQSSLLFKSKIIDISQLLIKLDIKYPIAKDNVTVTYHDPCNLKRLQGISKEPRALIKGISGINFVEMHKSDTCCGAAGTFCITNSDLSEKISLSKANNIINTDADIVLTSCPSCKIGLAQGLLKAGKQKQIYHPVELLYKLTINK